jgi:2,4-diketo-3-deoxy-L-fuconate hydrolase
MRFANINGRACIVSDDRALDIAAASEHALPSDPAVYTSVDHHPRLRDLGNDASEGEWVTFASEDVGPPVPRPGKVIAVALNYPSHAKESTLGTPDEPVVFSKVSSAICGPYDTVEISAEWSRIDYEAEVVVAIGAVMRDVDPAAVWSLTAGVTAGQDISDREEQFREPLRQFSYAKSYDTFAPIGPVLATVDEFPDIDDIGLVGRLDGLQVQSASTKELITNIPDLIAWISERMTLHPGDLVFTGTPAGVGNRRTPPLFLRDGMTLETEIPGVGCMRNIVRGRSPRRLDSQAKERQEA